MVVRREQDILAQRLIADSCNKQTIKPEQLVIHAGRGSSMTSKHVAAWINQPKQISTLFLESNLFFT